MRVAALALALTSLGALAVGAGGCEERDTFGAPCSSDRNCNDASYCVAGCGDNQGRCVPYGNDEDTARYRPVECCAGTLFYTGAVSDAYKSKLKQVVGNPVVRDAAKGFPPSLVNDVAADRAQQCLVCDGKLSVAPVGARCGPPAALAPSAQTDAAAAPASSDAGVDGAAAAIDAGSDGAATHDAADAGAP